MKLRDTEQRAITEAWFNNLTAMLFSVPDESTSSDIDPELQKQHEEILAELEHEFKIEQENLTKKSKTYRNESISLTLTFCELNLANKIKKVVQVFAWQPVHCENGANGE